MVSRSSNAVYVATNCHLKSMTMTKRLLQVKAVIARPVENQCRAKNEKYHPIVE
jgi:hypothetical protein